MNEAVRRRIAQLTADIAIREGRDDAADAAAFTTLLNSQYARAVDSRYYRWQFFESPLAGCVLLAHRHGEVVACYGLRVAAGTTPGSKFGMAVDLVVKPALRGVGLVARMEWALEQKARELGCELLYAFPNEDGYRPKVRELGWRDCGDRLVSVAPTTARAPSHRRLTARVVDAFGGHIGTAAAAFEANHSSRVRVARDLPYLTWRYSRCPRYHYESVEVHERGAPWGYLVLKRFSQPDGTEPIGDIVDLGWATDDAELVSELLACALAHFESAGVTQACLWLPTATVLDAAAARSGFVARSQRRFCVRTLTDSAEYADDGARWLVSAGDSELY